MGTATKKKKTETTEVKETKFSKEQILASEKYANRRDALNVLLAADGTYTVEQVDSLLEKFMKGKVN